MVATRYPAVRQRNGTSRQCVPREDRSPAPDQRVVGDRKQRHQDAPASFSPDHQRETEDAGREQGHAKPVSQRGGEVIRPSSSQIRSMTVGQMSRHVHDVGKELLMAENGVRAHDQERGRHDRAEGDGSTETNPNRTSKGIVQNREHTPAGRAAPRCTSLPRPSPVKMPAATRSRREPDSDSLTMARNPTSTMHVIGMSVTPKCESRT